MRTLPLAAVIVAAGALAGCNDILDKIKPLPVIALDCAPNSHTSPPWNITVTFNDKWLTIDRNHGGPVEVFEVWQYDSGLVSADSLKVSELITAPLSKVLEDSERFVIDRTRGTLLALKGEETGKNPAYYWNCKKAEPKF